MKKHLSIPPSALLLLTFALPCTHRTDDMPPLTEERMKEIKAQKTAYITTKLGLTPEEAQRFWPIYNEYDENREAIRREMRGLMRGDRTRTSPDRCRGRAAILTKGLAITPAGTGP